MFCQKKEEDHNWPSVTDQARYHFRETECIFQRKEQGPLCQGLPRNISEEDTRTANRTVTEQSSCDTAGPRSNGKIVGLGKHTSRGIVSIVTEGMERNTRTSTVFKMYQKAKEYNNNAIKFVGETKLIVKIIHMIKQHTFLVLINNMSPLCGSDLCNRYHT